MEMQVETYDCLEHQEMSLATIDDDSKHLIEVLALEGQKSLISPEKKAVRPYNLLTKEQQFICAILFPTVTPISDYDVGPIPYRVLKEAANAKEHFGHLYILHEAPMQIHDPILVGTKESIYGSLGAASKYELQKISLIARWGTALESWENLYEQAVKKHVQNTLNNFKAFKSKVENAIGLLEQGLRPTNEDFRFEHLENSMPFK